MIHKNKLI